ncbi:cyclic AMP-responsive element-binding protein 3 isoform X6 [Sturnira hondurensis]|nr:cyclic AMP-responsive element-binding protein 3 isoform X6 [Sturnira hondurensis]XP_036892112.1 cyclic AMP-responsive element-binding protein 3 isoform X6 [Sturnira hondurensis]XP_036892114.1 cyclic AMP-responsive element-binding protein 3 isoform X6 [Sturnira hondurensis]
MSYMELALDPGDQDLLGFLLEESGGLGAVPDEVLEAPLDWELPLSEVGGVSVGEAGGGDRSRGVDLNPVKALSDWDVEDFLSSLPSPPASLNILSNSNPRLVHHDHNYSLPQEHVSIDLDGICGKGETQMTPLHVEEPAEQEIVSFTLTDEEKRLLEQEGLTLPGTLPLTKMEEQVLKRVRRKIRNKKSAQESRRKKKVYLGALESRVLKYTAQNLELQNKVQLLEEQNLSLLDQLRRLQAMVIQIANKTSSSSTCVLVRMVTEVKIVLSGKGMGIFQSSFSFSFPALQVLLFSLCLIFVPAMYSSDTRGSLPAEHGVLFRQLRALPHQLELPALQSEVPRDSSDHELQAPGNSCCLLFHMPQTPSTEPPLKLPLPDPFSQFPCPGPLFPLHANLTREGGWLSAHRPIFIILQGRYSG